MCVHVQLLFHVFVMRVCACIAMLPRTYTGGYEHRWVATVAQVRSDTKEHIHTRVRLRASPTSPTISLISYLLS